MDDLNEMISEIIHVDHLLDDLRYHLIEIIVWMLPLTRLCNPLCEPKNKKNKVCFAHILQLKEMCSTSQVICNLLFILVPTGEKPFNPSIPPSTVEIFKMLALCAS